MAEVPVSNPPPNAHGGTGELEWPEELKKKATAWFTRGAAVADTRNYDYAIECYTNGLNVWPEAVTEGWEPLREVALRRQATGGKKPTFKETMTKGIRSKDAKSNLINAVFLLSKDPINVDYMEAIAKNASELNYSRVLRWVGPKLFEALRSEKKNQAQRYMDLRSWYEGVADNLTDPQLQIELLEQALVSCQMAMSLGINDLQTSQSMKSLAAKITMIRGNYEKNTSFRESVADKDQQAKIQDAQMVVKTDEQRERIIRAARADLEQSPGVSAKVFRLVDLLLEAGKKELEQEAIELLEKEYEGTKDFRFRNRVYDIRLRQGRRNLATLTERAKAATDAAAKAEATAKAEDMARKIIEYEIKVFAERVEVYPTDMTVRLKYGEALFRAGRHDDAISVFQVAQNDPKNQARALLLMGKSFFAGGFYPEAANTFKRALDNMEVQTDDTAKDLMYSLGRTHEEMSQATEARDYYSRILQLDFSYKDVRERLKNLRQA